jgi:hypothetical protein
MNFKTTLILVLLAAAVGVWVIVDMRQGDAIETSDTIATAGDGEALFTDLVAKDVTKVIVTPANGQRVVLEKGEKWRMVEPVAAAADHYVVEGLVRDLVGMRTTASIALAGDKAQSMGLDQPRFRVELVAKEGRTTKFAIGDRTAVGEGLYVQVDGRGDADVVKAGTLWEQLSEASTKLRDRQMVDVASTAIEQMTVEHGQEKFSLVKEAGTWRVTEPVQMAAEYSVVQDMLYAISGLRAEEFVAPEAGEASRTRLERPTVKVWFSTEPAATQPSTAPASQPAGRTILFGEYENALRDRVYVKVEGEDAIGKVRASSMQSFQKKVDDLRSLDVMNLTLEDVRRVEIALDGGETAVVERRRETAIMGPEIPSTQPATTQAATQPAEDVSKWVKADGSDADDLAIETLLKRMGPLRVLKYLDSNPTTQPAAVYTVKVTMADGAAHELRLVDGETTLTGEYQGLVFEVNRNLLDDVKTVRE